MYCSCIFSCFAKLPRHLLHMHHEEPEVIEAFRYSKKSQEGRRFLFMLRNKGNYQHNISILRTGSGVLVPSKHLSTQRQAIQYVVCKACLALIQSADKWKHSRKCDMKYDEGNRNRSIPCKKLMIITNGQAVNKGLAKKVLSKMNADSVVRTGKNHCLILKYGECLYHKNGHEQHQHNFISTQMREAARLVQSCVNVDTGTQQMKVCLLPRSFLL
jgi:hypothetical protein